MSELHPDDRWPVQATTRHRDYILTDYEPRCGPAGKLQPLSLLCHLLRSDGWLDDAWPVLARLRAGLGDDETVWGYKYGPSGCSLELYFYNFTDNAPGNAKSVTALAKLLASQLSFDSDVDERQRYFMCSFELTRDGVAANRGGAFRLYVGSGDQNRRQCGFSYRVDGSELVLENHYWFYYAARSGELADAVRRVQASPRAGARPCWSTLLPKSLRDCYTICYAVKPHADGLYYSRLATEQLAPFVGEHGHPALAATLEHHAADFAHVRWDLGFDFAAPPSARSLAIDKLAVHGVL